MVACIDFFEMSEICRPKFIVRHSTSNPTNESTAGTVSSANETEICDSEKESDDDGDDKDVTDEETPKKRKIYSEKDRVACEKNFKWLTFNERQKSGNCKICQKNITSNLTHIKRHEKTLVHQSKINVAKKAQRFEKLGVTIDFRAENKDLRI
jgi:hypothetical protein